MIKEYDRLFSTYGRKSVGPLAEGSLSMGIAGNTMITSIGMDSVYSDFIKLYPNVDFEFVRKTEDDVLVSTPEFQQHLIEGIVSGVEEIARMRGVIQ